MKDFNVASDRVDRIERAILIAQIDRDEATDRLINLHTELAAAKVEMEAASVAFAAKLQARYPLRQLATV